MIDDAKERLAYLKGLLAGSGTFTEEKLGKAFSTIVEVIEDLVNILDEIDIGDMLEEGDESVFKCPSCGDFIEVDPTKFRGREWIRLGCEKCGEMVLITRST